MSVIFSLDLDEELLSHLPIQDSWHVINGEGFTPKVIEDPFVVSVFNWQKQYIRDFRKPATVAVLEDQFPELHLDEPQTEIEDLLDRLRDRYAKNQQRKKLEQIVDLQANDPLSVPDALIKCGRELKTVLTKRGEAYGSGDVDRVLREYDKQVLQGPGASLGFKELNNYFYGLRGLTGVIGAPKSGKSWILIQILLDNVLQGRCTHLHSLELPAVESSWRLYCLLADVPFSAFTQHKLSREQRIRVTEASEILDESGLFKIVKNPSGERSIDHIVNQSRDEGADVILIDQLQYLESEDGINLGSSNSTGAYWQVLNRARDYSDDGPILYAHQFNRSAMSADSMPSMEMAKGSSSIEETATLALGLWADKDMHRLGKLEVGVLCARNHGYASWEIQVERRYGCRFEITQRLDIDE